MATGAGAHNPFRLSARQAGSTLTAMAKVKTVGIYLENGLRESAVAGRHNFLNRVSAALASCGVAVEYHPATGAARQRSADHPGHALFHMDDPLHNRALSFRRAYFYPFWTIEPTARRWEFHAARTRFDPDRIDPEQARRLVSRHRERQFPGAEPGDDGFIYVPLQGILSRQRSFQSCSPLDMIAQTARRFPDRPVIATLHPRETYTPQDHAALADLQAAHPNLELRSGGMQALLPRCRMVVTQNSSVAFSGYFFEKPAVLFGRIDFHHIAANVGQLGAGRAFDMAGQMRPDYARYLFWFLQRMAINAGRPEAEEKILRALRRGGWDL
ncbi:MULTISPECIES: glycosyltransferase family protein [Actibacterium]|uniref:Capsule polysaccharide biosynthesis protein n=1 Tax=Actibacterium naphthalenivorans TaxID=1614693 RepID=A0A840CC39_9RHOB|nr:MULTISPECIES: hypothetical protein [Actibacterium]MBB4021632.1 hypothetical protein [Actibacterium naphthalenivorans]